MNEYIEQAQNFLKRADATMEIKFIGRSINRNWDDNVRNFYNFTIQTPRGEMHGDFWDSIYDTEISSMTKEDYAKRRFKCEYQYLTGNDQLTVRRELAWKQQQAVPTEYDILACLTKDDPGTFSDFCFEYGYSDDSIKARNIYFAVQKEWSDLRRIFTKKQLEELAEIS